MWRAPAGNVTTYFDPLEEQVGADKAIDLAQRPGIRFRYSGDADRASPGHGVQWGSFTVGVSQTTALDLATAYATLAADGRHCDPRPVQRITDPSGRPVTAGGATCRSAVSPDVARATMDAARCPVGDRPASGDRCGPRKGPVSAVRAAVGRPVAGVFGISSSGTEPVLALAGPQLVTAGLIGDGANRGIRVGAATRTRPIETVTEVQSTGLRPLPHKDFAAPSRKLTGVAGQDWW
jgi:membrane peptidoglycan carboxypeptidase